ncbi:hypothetical protein GCM10009583_00530 [Ornithinicoccus hortensis]
MPLLGTLPHVEVGGAQAERLFDPVLLVLVAGAGDVQVPAVGVYRGRWIGDPA